MLKMVVGQRWLSESEPDLGLGILLKAEYGRADLFFPAVEQQRQYSLETAALRRVILKVGDTLIHEDGERYLVTSFENQEGLIVYQCGDVSVIEEELSSTMDFSGADDRLLAGRTDAAFFYKLRKRTLEQDAAIRCSPVRGFVGGKVDLIPHQLSIVKTVAESPFPRVLLADEVGLGKTIEACQILQHLVVSGRVQRVLVVVPEPLKHQWFVELLRRFHMLFALFDEERCQSIEAGDPHGNPFLDDQLVLCSLDFLSQDKKRADQVVDAGWDCLVVDEAHHLEWTPKEVSEEYQLVDSLCQKVPSIFLLTATPQQLGASGHFARLRLLDPVRFACLKTFAKESEVHERIAGIIDVIEGGEELSKKDQSFLKGISPRLLAHSEKDKELFIRDLLDSFSTGHLMFRNRRKHLQGFPKRNLHAHVREPATNEFRSKLDWLIDFLMEDSERKVLLIVSTREMVGRLAEAIRAKVNVNLAEFHEDLELIQRDRNAAYFAEDEGAQLLLCSEIGSEGRNFQFCHHLVLFDLPENPDLLEQRIGRLDRIGQSEDISIHVPVVKDTYGERLMVWYRDGLEAFESTVVAGGAVYRELENELDLALEDGEGIEDLIKKTLTKKRAVSQQLEQGYDRLLARSSFNEQVASEVKEAILVHDQDQAFEKWAVKLMEYCGLNVERLEDRAYVLKPGNLLSDAFPEVPEEGVSATFDRETALSREHWAFLSIDHPIIRNAIDLLLSSEKGNSSFMIWNGPGGKRIFLEGQIFIDCLAAGYLGVERFLPPSIHRIAIDHENNDCTDDEDLKNSIKKELEPQKIMASESIAKQVLPNMVKNLEKYVERIRLESVAKAEEVLQKYHEHESDRLADLCNKQGIDDAEKLEELSDRVKEIDHAIKSARSRIDNLRLVVRIS